MAGQAGESESLKRSYYSRKNQFYNTTSHLSKHALKQSLRLNHKHNINIAACQQVLKKQVLKCSSSCKLCDYLQPMTSTRLLAEKITSYPSKIYESMSLTAVNSSLPLTTRNLSTINPFPHSPNSYPVAGAFPTLLSPLKHQHTKINSTTNCPTANLSTTMNQTVPRIS